MLYRVTYRNDKWYIGGAECTGSNGKTGEDEAMEFIARRFKYQNEDRARIIMNAIMKESKAKNGTSG